WFLILALVTGLTACAAAQAPATGSDSNGETSSAGEVSGAETEWKGEIPIGVLFSRDGAWGTYGAKSFRAIDFAIEDVNAAGGINGYRLVAKVYDNHAQIEQVAAIVRKMALEDRVVAMIGPNTSGEGEVAFPIAAQLGLPVVSTSTAKGGMMGTGQDANGKQ